MKPVIATHCEMKINWWFKKKLQIANPDPIDAVNFYITECRVSDASNYINVVDEGCPIKVLNEWLDLEKYFNYPSFTSEEFLFFF